jgi:hypothetical protein
MRYILFISAQAPAITASWIPFHIDYLKTGLETVPEEKLASQKLAGTNDTFYGFSGLNESDDARCYADNRKALGRRCFAKDTPQAGSPSRQHRCGLTVKIPELLHG